MWAALGVGRAQLYYLDRGLWSGKIVPTTTAFLLSQALTAARDEDRLRLLISRRPLLPLLRL